MARSLSEFSCGSDISSKRKRLCNDREKRPVARMFPRLHFFISAAERSNTCVRRATSFKVQMHNSVICITAVLHHSEGVTYSEIMQA